MIFLNVYLIGGAIRDKLLNIIPNEKDWVVIGSDASTMLRLNFCQVGKGFPVFLHYKTKEEYALARKEIKNGFGYHGFFFDTSKAVSLSDDLFRRDLTINSIALSIDGKIIDPYSGVFDLLDGLIKHISISFIEDPLRIFRTARFAAKFFHLGFSVYFETILLMKRIVLIEEVKNLTTERIWQEILKSLVIKNSVVFFSLLFDIDVFGILFFRFLFFLNGYKKFDYILQSKNWIFLKILIDFYFSIISISYLRLSVLFSSLFDVFFLNNIFEFNYSNFICNIISDFWSFSYKLANFYKKNTFLIYSLFYLYSNLFRFNSKVIFFILKKIDIFRYKKRFIDLLYIFENYLNVRFDFYCIFFKYFIFDIIFEIKIIKEKIVKYNFKDKKYKKTFERNLIFMIKKIKLKYFKIITHL